MYFLVIIINTTYNSQFGNMYYTDTSIYNRIVVVIFIIDSIDSAVHYMFHGVVVITSALHAEGRRFEPGWNLTFYNLIRTF